MKKSKNKNTDIQKFVVKEGLQATQTLIDKAISQSNSREILDFRELEFDQEFFGYENEDYSHAAAASSLVKPVVCISNDVDVKIIYFPPQWDYVVFDNLCSLEELHISSVDPKNTWFHSLQWLICRNLPNLKKITVNCEVIRWLEIDDVESLQNIDLRKSCAIDHLSILNAPSLKKIDIKGCKKLKKIIGMDLSKQSELGVTDQIANMQAKSKLDGAIYKNMTFTDIDHVLWNINYGVKIASLGGFFLNDDEESEHEDICYGHEDDPNFNNFSFALLRPLEFVYTGGTGETYAYEFLYHDFSNGQYGVFRSEGKSTQESCLNEALNGVSDMYLNIPGVRSPEEKQILKFLNALVAKESGKVV